MENVFAKRLKQARQERGMRRVELADRCGIALRAFEEYESGRVLPRVDKVIVIAQELDCSTDFLCGLEN
jgi:transcriptional regulator with XRE-family HTH domain